MNKDRPREQARPLRKGGQTVVGDNKGKEPPPKEREQARPLRVGGLRIVSKTEKPPKASNDIEEKNGGHSTET